MGDTYTGDEFLEFASGGESATQSIDRMKKNAEKEKEGSSFWGSKMEGLLPEAFKNSPKKGGGGKKKEEGGGGEEEEKAKAKYEAERSRLIRKHNAYIRSDSIRKVLEEGGYHCQLLQPNTSLSIAKDQLEVINTIRNAHMARKGAQMLMQKVNQLTESFLPELKGAPSLSMIWDAEASRPGSQVHLDMEELSIELEPYITMGFWGRFAGDYIMLVDSLRRAKASPEWRSQFAQQSNLDKEEEEVDERYNEL